MAITAERITVGATPVALNTPGVGGRSIHIKNLDPTETADIGPSTVAAGAGFLLGGDESIVVETDARDGLFAVRSGAIDLVLAVLRT